jgi:hypothetical protein
MTITINMPEFEKQEVRKPSEMTMCKPFLAVDEHGEPCVIIRLGSGAMVYFDGGGSCSYTGDHSEHWADSKYTVVTHAEIDIRIDVKLT